MLFRSDNRLLWRMNRRRLEAEAWRDAVLATSGELDPTMQGPSVSLDDSQMRRRTVYGIVSRQKPADLFRLFDFPDAKRHAENRLPTTTPLQHLYLLNSPFLQKQAEAVVVADEASNGGADAGSIRYVAPVAEDIARNLFRRILLRNPTNEELTEALGLVQIENGTVPQVNWFILAHSLMATNEFMHVD